MDKGKVTSLTLLAISGAFDTIYRNMLIKRLSMWCGIFATALSWFSLYLTGRYHRVKRANCFSAALPTSCGVPRGYVLGPLLFSGTTHFMWCSSGLCSWTITFQRHYPLHVVFLGVMFLDHYVLLLTLLHSAQLFKLNLDHHLYADLPFLGYPGYKLLLKPTQGLSL